MKDIGPLHHFLGVLVEQRSDDLFLHQRQYTRDILECDDMSNCKPCSTPIDTQAKVSSDMGAPVCDPTVYCSLVGTLQYFTFTRPNIAYAVQQVCLHMHDPHEPHLTVVKRILWYFQGTIDHGLLLRRASTLDLVVYTDADRAGCLDTRQSPSGYAVFLGDNLVSWSLKCQNVISRSSAEAEYHDVVEACWLHQLLVELHSPLSRATLVYCDNVSAIYISTNPIQHQCTKHIKIDLHFVCERVGDVRVLHVSTISQFTNIFTNGLPSSMFSKFRCSLNICSG
jgi:hypothetical protein